MYKLLLCERKSVMEKKLGLGILAAIPAGSIPFFHAKANPRSFAEVTGMSEKITGTISKECGGKLHIKP